MNLRLQMKIELTIVTSVFVLSLLGCSDAGDSSYRLRSEQTNVPTVHLVVDEIEPQEVQFASSTSGSVYYGTHRVSYHVQSDAPVEHDTFILVRHNSGDDDYKPSGSDMEKGKLIVILAGRTQSTVLKIWDSFWSDEQIDDLNAFYQRFGVPEERQRRLTYDDKHLNKVITLPSPHERATILPTSVSYLDTAGIKQKKNLLVEYPFNEYRVGKPDTIRVKDAVEEDLRDE